MEDDVLSDTYWFLRRSSVSIIAGDNKLVKIALEREFSWILMKCQRSYVIKKAPPERTCPRIRKMRSES